MAQSNLDMSSANFGIPTPPANDNSDVKDPFFPNSVIPSNKEEEKKKISNINDSSENSMPSTPEPIQSQSKFRFYITDPSLVPLLVARIAETNNIKLPDNSNNTFNSGNYGDLSVSTAPSVCESVSSLPDLSDSASISTSTPEDDSSDSTATTANTSLTTSSTSSSTDQSRPVTGNVMSCVTSSTTPTMVTSSSSIAATSYSGRVLQRLANSSNNVTVSSNNPSNVTTNENVISGNPSRSSIANAIVAAAAAPRMVPTPNRSARRSKRKGIPYKSPSHDDLLREPGFVFSFPILFNNALPTCKSHDDGTKEINNNTESGSSTTTTTTTTTTNTNTTTTTNSSTSSEQNVLKNNSTSIKSQSAKIIHRPLLLPDIVRSLHQARRSKMRTRPVTRAKNKRENQELDVYQLMKLGLEHMMDSQHNSATMSEEAKAGKRRVSTVGRPSKRTSLSSQVSRSFNSGENKSPRGSSICSTSSSSSTTAFYRIPSSKRRDSASLSSLSSIPPSELSDFDLNSDNFGDDEDDPDFAPPAKKRKSEVQRGSKTVGRKESSSKVKVCASCRTKSTPCWRPGWSTDLMLCNSCGLRYKKTKCVCANPDCRYIPLKSEYNAMFKKPKNGDAPDVKRCCKCQNPL